MAKIDCSITSNYLAEEKRMCESYDETCRKCPLYHYCSADNYNIPEKIAAVQKWSDEHPILTRKEKFINMCKENGFDGVINKKCIYPTCIETNCEECKVYWEEAVSE